MLRDGWAVAHPLRVLAPRHAAIRSGQVRRPLALRARGRACAVGASASLVRAAFLFCHQLRRHCPVMRAVRRRRALSLLRTIVGGGLPVYV